VYLCKQNKPANFDSGGCSETWLRALIAEALPSITMQRYEKELKHPNELQDNPFWEHFICIKGEIKESPQGLTNLNIVLR